MRHHLLSLVSAAVIALSAGSALAAPIVTNVAADPALSPGLGSFGNVVIGPGGDDISASKTFDTVAPITLNFTVTHTQGGGSKFVFTETITNNTNSVWSDFHFSIIEPPEFSGQPGRGVVFTSFQQSTLSGFDLLGPSQTIPGFEQSGPRALNFINGNLAPGQSTTAVLDISPFDPGNNCGTGPGNSGPCTYTFKLVQVPTVGNTPPVDVPEPASLGLFGLGLLGLAGFRRRPSA